MAQHGHRGRGGGRRGGGWSGVGGGGKRLDRPIYFKRKILFETSAPPVTRVVLDRVPEDLRWKFPRNSNPSDERYWVKLEDEDRFKPAPRLLRETCQMQHDNNVRQLCPEVESLLEQSLRKTENGCSFSCEARLGRLAWVVSESKQEEDLCLGDFSNPSQYENNIKEEFYTRTTTKADDMIARFQGLPTSAPDPRNVVTLQLKCGEDFYRAHLDENAHGTFTFNIEENCTHKKSLVGSHKADIMCFGRSYDVRIASDCRKIDLPLIPMPDEVKRDVRRIAESVKRNDRGRLVMMLRAGQVQVDHVRQNEIYNFTTSEGYEIHFYKLKESVISWNVRPNEVVELEEKDNQEIEVKVEKTLCDRGVIREALQEVKRLVSFAMDVVDMAEECKDPAMPY